MGNPMVRGARWATVHWVAESDMTDRLTWFMKTSFSLLLNFMGIIFKYINL